MPLCAHCGAAFERAASTQKFCRSECRLASYKAARPPKKPRGKQAADYTEAKHHVTRISEEPRTDDFRARVIIRKVGDTFIFTRLEPYPETFGRPRPDRFDELAFLEFEVNDLDSLVYYDETGVSYGLLYRTGQYGEVRVEWLSNVEPPAEALPPPPPPGLPRATVKAPSPTITRPTLPLPLRNHYDQSRDSPEGPASASS